MCVQLSRLTFDEAALRSCIRKRESPRSALNLRVRYASECRLFDVDYDNARTCPHCAALLGERIPRQLHATLLDGTLPRALELFHTHASNIDVIEFDELFCVAARWDSVPLVRAIINCMACVYHHVTLEYYIHSILLSVAAAHRAAAVFQYVITLFSRAVCPVHVNQHDACMRALVTTLSQAQWMRKLTLRMYRQMLDAIPQRIRCTYTLSFLQMLSQLEERSSFGSGGGGAHNGDRLLGAAHIVALYPDIPLVELRRFAAERVLAGYDGPHSLFFHLSAGGLARKFEALEGVSAATEVEYVDDDDDDEIIIIPSSSDNTSMVQ